jgi:uncharacterized protein
MATHQQLAKPNLLSFIRNFDPVSKRIFIILGLGFVIFLIFRSNIISYIRPEELTLAAGDEEGESHVIGEAIKKVVEEKDKTIKIRVLATKGTTQNLEMLEKGEAQLITAQADVAVQEMDLLASSKVNSFKPKAEARTVAVLYQDFFQLVVRDPNIKQFGQLRGKRIALRAGGGQYESFLKVAEHYGLMQKDAKVPNVIIKGLEDKYYDDRQAEEDFKNQNADALFRVRALGNKGISTSVQQYDGQLVPIEQAAGMKIKYPAFEPGIIPKGAYGGNPPVPDTDLLTVAVPRLFLASDKVNKETIKTITQIIYEHRQEIADAIDEVAKEHNKYEGEYETIKPLMSNISSPRTSDNKEIPIPMHPGAIAFYERDKDFLKENAEYLSFLWGIVVVIGPLTWELKSSWERRRKDKADGYIKLAIELMKDDKYNLDQRQHKLDHVFKEAADALDREKISQESFRTFNEAYKTTREAIERDRQLAQEVIEGEQKKVSAEHIESVLKLLQQQTQSKDLLHQELDKILQNVAINLIDKKISEESFRTFIEAYRTARDVVERKK